jgi:hypothetical protein
MFMDPQLQKAVGLEALQLCENGKKADKIEPKRIRKVPLVRWLIAHSQLDLSLANSLF